MTETAWSLSSLHLHPFVNEPYPWDVPPLPRGWAPLIPGSDAARHSDARSDGGQNRDECLNHQFPNVSLFHSSNYNLPFTMYNSVIQFPSLTGRVREGLSFPFWPVTLQRYNSVPWDVKRHPRFGGDLTLRGLVILSAAKNLSAQAKVLYCWCLQILRSPQNDKKWKLLFACNFCAV